MLTFMSTQDFRSLQKSLGYTSGRADTVTKVVPLLTLVKRWYTVLERSEKIVVCRDQNWCESHFDPGLHTLDFYKSCTTVDSSEEVVHSSFDGLKRLWSEKIRAGVCRTFALDHLRRMLVGYDLWGRPLILI